MMTDPSFFTNERNAHMRFMIIALIVMLMGCGSDDSLEEVAPVAKFEGATGTLAEMKIPDRVAMAPTAPGTGIPFVKEVSYYHDWKRTKPLKGTVSPGKTIHIKIVFSEGMTLKVSDNKDARPILYYRVAGKNIRFRIAGFGAKGEDFVSGDAKPTTNKATYYGKYTVHPEDPYCYPQVFL